VGLLAVDLLRAGPALRGAQHDHRPGRALGLPPGGGVLEGPLLDLGDLVQRLVEHRGEALVDLQRVLVVEAAGEEQRGVAAAAQQRLQDRKSTRLNSSHVSISYAVFCLKKTYHISSTMVRMR